MLQFPCSVFSQFFEYLSSLLLSLHIRIANYTPTQGKVERQKITKEKKHLKRNEIKGKIKAVSQKLLIVKFKDL